VQLKRKGEAPCASPFFVKPDFEAAISEEALSEAYVEGVEK